MAKLKAERLQPLTCPTGILSPRGEEEVSIDPSKSSPLAAKGNFSLAPWGSRRLIISEYVSEGARRAGEGLHLSTVCSTLAGLYIVPYGLTIASNWFSTNRRPMFSAKQEPTNRSLSDGLILNKDLTIFTFVCSSI